MKIWFVECPLDKWNEDVEQLAIDNNLKIVNKALELRLNLSVDIVEQNPPTLTEKGI